MAANGLLFVDIVILERKILIFSFNTPGARSGLKVVPSFSAFSTVSCPGLSPLAGSVGPRVAARSGAALFDEECRQDPEFLNRVLGPGTYATRQIAAGVSWNRDSLCVFW